MGWYYLVFICLCPLSVFFFFLLLLFFVRFFFFFPSLNVTSLLALSIDRNGEGIVVIGTQAQEPGEKGALQVLGEVGAHSQCCHPCQGENHTSGLPQSLQ